MVGSISILLLGMFIWISIGMCIGLLVTYLRNGFPIFGLFWGFLISFVLMLGGSIIISNVPWLNSLFIF